MVTEPATVELQPPLQPPDRMDWQTAGKLLDTREYEQVTNLLHEAYLTAVHRNEMTLASILAAAYQICQTCTQFYRDIAAYQQAQEIAAVRERELRQQLQALLGTIQAYETADLPQPSSLHLARSPRNVFSQDNIELTQKPALWQRAQNLWGRKPNALTEPNVSLDWIRSRPTIPTHTSSTANSQIKGDSSLFISDVSETAVKDQAVVAEQNDNPSLAVYCLGTFRIYEDGHPLEEWPGRKGKSILKYLLLNRHRSVTKEVLMELFWPDSDPDAARNNLNVAIYGLRQGLRNGYPDFSHILFQNDCYLLNPDLDIWLDVEEFKQHLNLAREAEQKDRLSAMIAAYQTAEALYQGELFEEDRYEEWLMSERQSLQDDYLRLLEKLSNYYYDNQEYNACITLCQKMLGVEPYLESVHRHLMRAYARQNHHFLALRQYYRCAEVLMEELDIVPDASTTQLYEAIRRRESV